MNQSTSSYPFRYEDEYISYQSLFSSFKEENFLSFDKKFQKLSLDIKVQELFAGKKINFSENQAALHHIYRSSYGHKLSDIDHNQLEDIQRTIDGCIRLKDILLKKGIKNIVTVGIGGSFEGPKLLIETLTDKHSRNFNHIFLTGPDKNEFLNEILPLKREDTFFIISTKSFTTDETIQSLSLARNWIDKDLNFEDHFICVTSQKEKAKNFGFTEKTIIQFPNEIGGRYSLWSPISLSAMLELDEEFYEFLKGGSEADFRLVKNDEFKKFYKICGLQ